MFMLRRTGFRAAIAAAKPTPSVIVPKARTFVSVNQSKLRLARSWTASPTQRRFASDDAAATKKPAETEEQLAEKIETEPAKEDSATEQVAAKQAAVDAASENPAAVVEEVVAEAGETSSEAMDAQSSVAADTAAAAATGIATGTASTTSRSPQTGSQVSPTGSGTPSVNNTLYVGNIFFEVNEQSLQDYFSRFGNIVKAKIVYDARGLSKGFGYVEFENVDDATKAVESTNQQVFQGRRLAVQFHRPRTAINRRGGGANPPSKTLFIGNMSFEMSDKDLSDLFREVRNVIDVRIAIDRRTGQPRGFAHADFIDVNSAAKAMEFLKGKEMYGRQLRVDYSLSTPRAPTNSR